MPVLLKNKAQLSPGPAFPPLSPLGELHLLSESEKPVGRRWEEGAASPPILQLLSQIHRPQSTHPKLGGRFL